MGAVFRLVKPSTRPILFFVIIALTRALKVRLLPEYVCRRYVLRGQQVWLTARGMSAYHLVWVYKSRVFYIILEFES